jgi:predicted protein tyrosine phosphatase
MKTVTNFSRKNIREYNQKLSKDSAIWISIGEPGEENSKVVNESLSEIPHLHLDFWDVVQPIEFDGEIFHPPSDEDARKIVDFILEHKDKDILVNCAAGVSRSGAIAQFCSYALAYKWTENGKRKAVPNFLLYNKMISYYLSKNEPEV